ncbi:hypothetical protein F3157_21740 [Virgibacillus dakarensis]|uniref:DUF6792 domain-containing protein n=1 Tax=Lentibacillus populi TaxID=1827502 RepID=A0A9W5X4H5_9BACI|nr:DUF6792 domain-containing protein [Lentibacillus populi]MBT2218026.1 hypothetical protein [Virgibacillus dakarensis]MTW88219.1 hypothetical protein [Virgibacillus dakarensis]GGB32110.1 hypothetical protein GCM10011409_06870 [Lentibacillus populi]
MNDAIINSPEMRLRLIQLEYGDLPEEEFKEKVKRIYLEETGKELTANIKVRTSKEAKIGNDSGYDGTAIYFNSRENDIKEVYIISQGSQGMEDWKYNLEAMLAGQNISQAKDTDEFVKDVKNHFNIQEVEKEKKENSTPIIGLSHSLAHNNNTTAYLLYDTFDEVYSVNGAQTNYYQLFNADNELKKRVEEKFSISTTDPDAIYNIDPEKLRAFAENHYKGKAKNIHQIISEDDPLYAVSGVRGFFTLGDVRPIDTIPGYPGLRSIMDDIPDDVVKDLQELAIQYTVSSQNGGANAAIQDLLGVNMDVVNQFDGIWSVTKIYATNQSEIDTMIRDVNDKLPGLLTQIKTVTTNADVIFQRFVDARYISVDQKNLIVTELMNIQKELDGMQKSISTLVDIRNMHNFSAQLGGDIGTYLNIKDRAEAIKESLSKLNNKEFQKLLKMIGSGHQIQGILEAMGEGNKSYLGTDMILTTSGKEKIQVNISAALRMYDEGKGVLEDKLSEIKRLQVAIEREIVQCYKEKRTAVMNKIFDMESNPRTYTYLLRKHVYFSRLDKSIIGINVHEAFFPIDHAAIDDRINSLNESVEKGYTHLENYRTAIEDLFEEEEKIANLFDVVGGL